MLFYEKLLTARRLLAISQKEASEEAGINQATLSILEKGERKFIPTEYLQFLYKKGIDINWIIDENNRTDNIFHNNFLPNDQSDKRPNHLQNSNINGGSSISSLLSNAGFKPKNKNGLPAGYELDGKKEPDLSPFLKEILQELKKMNDNLQLVTH